MGKGKSKQKSFEIQSFFLTKLTSVRAQLQLIAVHRKMFINNIIKNKMPSVMHSHSSQDGRMPVSSHIGDITVNGFRNCKIFESFIGLNGTTQPVSVFFGKYLYARGASAGSRTKTVVAANIVPSSEPSPVGCFPTSPAVNTSPGQTSFAHPPLHWATSH